jgi:hypothetical protein
VLLVPRDCAEEVDEEEGTTEMGSSVCSDENDWKGADKKEML